MNYFYLYLLFLLIYSFDIFYTITTKYCYKGTTARHIVCAVCVLFETWIVVRLAQAHVTQTHLFWSEDHSYDFKVHGAVLPKAGQNIVASGGARVSDQKVPIPLQQRLGSLEKSQRVSFDSQTIHLCQHLFFPLYLRLHVGYTKKLKELFKVLCNCSHLLSVGEVKLIPHTLSCLCDRYNKLPVS